MVYLRHQAQFFKWTWYSSKKKIILFNNKYLKISNPFNSFKAFKDPDVDLIIIIFMTIACALFLFVPCFYGCHVTVNYLNVANDFYEANWYALSSDKQKYFIMMISNAQLPRFYHGCHMINLDLGTYTKVDNHRIHYHRFIFFFEIYLFSCR